MTTSASVPVGVQLYSLREEAAVDFPAVLERVGEMGFVGVEFAGFNGLSASEVAGALEGTGLQVASAHVGLAEPDQIAAALDDHAAIGCDTVVIPAVMPAGFEGLDQVKGTADLVNAANEIARARGIALGYHNHFWELVPIDDGRPALLHFFEHLAPDVIALRPHPLGPVVGDGGGDGEEESGEGGGSDGHGRPPGERRRGETG